MQTELTKEIKRALRTYRPILPSRPIRWAEEVDVGSGYVDSIRFEDYIKNIDEIYYCNKFEKDLKNSDIDDPPCGNKTTCIGCVYKSCALESRELGIACTCYEIKITKSDFQSNHGHNFVGNFNYYVVPKKLYPQIKNLVSKDIGVITYAGHGDLRRRKESAFKQISAENLNRYLFNAMKKWCDLSYFQLEKFLEGGA